MNNVINDYAPLFIGQEEQEAQMQIQMDEMDA